MRNEVYWNLHKHLYSMRALEGPDRGRVVAHEAFFRLTNVKFAVQPAGRAKVLRDKAKNVHAFVRGTPATDRSESGLTNGRAPERVLANGWPTLQAMFDVTEWQRVTYNPYKYSTFVNASTGEPIHSAREVVGLSWEVDGRITPKMWARV